jgi:hypothetical protein
MKNICVKIKHFEFWNTHLFHLPVYLYWLFLAVKSRRLFFFTSANPGIETGGLLGESKYKILQKINPVYLPKTLYYQQVPLFKNVVRDVNESKISFPFIVKPDVGQGGWLVSLIKDLNDLQIFLRKIKMPFMIQEFIDYPMEFGVLYYRYPGCDRGFVTSLACKELAYVIGDGKSTVRSLVYENPRTRQCLSKLANLDYAEMTRIPSKGEKVMVSFIGNHSFGTRFVDMNTAIDQTLTYFFDCLCRSIPGFYFGRFDIRCHSLEDLKTGNFKILELNGVGSEPLHIFDPSQKIWQAYHSAFRHWRVIYEIASINRRSFRREMKIKDAWTTFRYVSKLQRMHNTELRIGN